MFGLFYFLSKNVYQPTFNTLELKRGQVHRLFYWLEIKRG